MCHSSVRQVHKVLALEKVFKVMIEPFSGNLLGMKGSRQRLFIDRIRIVPIPSVACIDLNGRALCQIAKRCVRRCRESAGIPAKVATGVAIRQAKLVGYNVAFHNQPSTKIDAADPFVVVVVIGALVVACSRHGLRLLGLQKY